MLSIHLHFYKNIFKRVKQQLQYLTYSSIRHHKSQYSKCQLSHKKKKKYYK